jgi:NADP-dependent 3-hydroxy acid dehydrogenase YdfG
MLYYNEVPRTTLKVVRTTIISPGSIDTELREGISGSELKSAIDEDMKIAIEPASIARAIAFAIEQPSDVAINEMIVRPTIQEL